MMRRIAMLLAAVLLALTGCSSSTHDGGTGAATASPKGYQWKSLHRPNVKTIAVDIFESRDFRRGEEFRITTALAKEIEAYTPYKIAPRDKADTLLEGQIRRIRRPVLSNSGNGGVPNEQLFELTVDFTWKDLRSGKILVSRSVFEQITAYYPTLGEGSFIGSQLAAEKLAQGIVQQLEADW